MNANQRIVFYDGVCSLCNFWIRTLKKADKKSRFNYISLQSTEAKNYLNESQLLPEKNTLYFFDGSQIWQRSAAVLKIMSLLNNGWYFLAKILSMFPLEFRDYIYSMVAKNRYNWFGKQDSCVFDILPKEKNERK